MRRVVGRIDAPTREASYTVIGERESQDRSATSRSAGLRVLHVIGTLRGGGAETLVRELLPRLRARGLEVAAYSAHPAGLTAAERAAAPYPILDGNKRGHLDLGFGPRTLGAIARFAPQVVHTHTFTGKYWGRACAVAAGVPVIVHTEHSPAPRLARWEVPLCAALAPRTAALIAFSDRTAAHVAAREPHGRIVVIPNGIEIGPRPGADDRARARTALGAAPDVVVVGVVASFQPKKNQQLAIRALAALPSRAKVRLDLFGSGAQEAALRELADACGVAAQVRFWGFRPDVRALLPGLDVLLSVATVEAAPISLLEAMAAGVPVVGTPHHGTLDFVADRTTGLVLAEWSVAAVQSALAFAAGDADWRSRAGRAARERAECAFDIEAVADAHVRLYAELTASRTGGAHGATTSKSVM